MTSLSPAGWPVTASVAVPDSSITVPSGATLLVGLETPTVTVKAGVTASVVAPVRVSSALLMTWTTLPLSDTTMK